MIKGLNVVLTSLFVLLSASAGAQEFNNFSFEVWGVDGVCEVNTPPDGWMGYSTAGDEFEEGNFSICASTIPFNAADGNSYGRAYAENATTGEGVVQELSGLIPGNIYQLSFQFAGSNLYPGINSIEWHVFIDDVDIDQTVAVSSDEATWTLHVLQFAASSPSHFIGFRAFTVDGSGSGSAAIDHIILEDITPEEEVLPIASFTQNDDLLCVEDCIVFENTSVFESSVAWAFEGGTPASSTSLDGVTVCYATPGAYMVSLTATNEDGSDALIIQNAVTVNPFPEGAITVSGESLVLDTDGSEGSVSWQLDGLVLNETGYSLTPFETGLYEITLVSPFLCNTSIFYSAVTPDADEGTRLDDGVWIPNAITLDGDGLNDAWMVYGNRGNWVEFRATVYNRWGEVIFISNDPEIPWIGNDSSGNHFVPNGLYLYEVTLRLTEEIEVRLYHGHISVLR